MGGTLTIDAGALRAEVVPAVGGGLARFERRAAGGAEAIFRPWPDGGTDNPRRLALMPLVPWSNRVSGGGFSLDGRFHALPPTVAGDAVPIHGNGWQSAWSVAHAAADAVTLALAAEGPGPYRYDAELAYAIDAGGLTVRLGAVNRAAIALPYGLGLHPWLPRSRGTTLQARASAVWLEDAQHLPTGSAPLAAHPEWDFSETRPLPRGRINNGFAGWDGEARIAWPERGLGLAVHASAGLSTYIVYSPGADADFFCFEPVSHPVDAHNLPGGPAANGLVLLQPGGRLDVACRFAVAGHGPDAVTGEP